MSPETRVMLSEILVMSLAKKSQVARRNKYQKDLIWKRKFGSHMVLSETKSALVIKKFLNVIAYLQSEILIFLVFVSSGDLTFFFGRHY